MFVSGSELASYMRLILVGVQGIEFLNPQLKTLLASAELDRKTVNPDLTFGHSDHSNHTQSTEDAPASASSVDYLY